jgi:ABC-type nitrate/sulfonate/bicarbonate transport system permease component
MEYMAHHTLVHTVGMSAINVVVGSLLAVAAGVLVIKVLSGGDR